MSISARTVAPAHRSLIRTPPAPEPQATAQAPGRGHRLPGWARVLLAVVATALSAFSVILPTLIPGVLDKVQGPEATATTALIVIMIIWAPALPCYLLTSFLLTRYVDRRPPAVLGLRLSARSMAGLLGATALAAAVVLLVRVVVHMSGGGQPVDANPGGAPLALVIAYGLARAFLLQGIGEEVLWRGYVLQSLSARPKRALWVSVLVFTAMHLISQGGQDGALDRVLYLIPTFGFALLAGCLALWTRSVWPAIGIHGGFHTGHVVATVAGVNSLSIPQEVAVGLIMTVLALVVVTRITPQRWAEIAQRGPYAPVR